MSLPAQSDIMVYRFKETFKCDQHVTICSPISVFTIILHSPLTCLSVSQGPEMKIQANSQTPIQGEVNILRYLSRLLTPAYDASDDIITVANIDNFLDLASSTLLNGTSKEKAAGVRGLNSALGRGDWLVGSGPTVADIAVWSALHQTGLASGAPSNVQKWLKSCAAQSDFRTALNAVA